MTPNPDSVVVTRYFKVSPRSYVRSRMLLWVARWWWIVALPVALMVFSGLYDPRFFFLAFALILIVYPALMAHVFLSHALSPVAALSVVPHRLVFDSGAVTVEYLPQEDFRTPAPRVYSRDLVAMVEDTGHALVFHLSHERYGYLEVPASAFADGDMARVLRDFSKQ